MASAFLYAVPTDAHEVAPGTHLARISRVHRGAVDVITATGELRAELSAPVAAQGAADPSLLPCVGDLCIVSFPPEVRVLDVLPRKSAVTRASVTPGSSHRQVLAANVDVLAVVEPLSSAPVLGRIERLLALAWESGAAPVVVLSKSDLDPDPDEWVREVSGVAPGAPVIAVSQRTGDGIDELRHVAQPGAVLAFVGPSGAGKSTLVNALANIEVMDTAEIRDDGRGRHTTTHRELILLPDGSLVIDTPGLRSVGLATAEALDHVFNDIAELAAQCRFNDCVHETEPGCAITEAIETGELPERRLQSWRKLQREADYQERRTNARLRAAERDLWKQRTKEMRQRGNRP